MKSYETISMIFKGESFFINIIGSIDFKMMIPETGKYKLKGVATL